MAFEGAITAYHGDFTPPANSPSWVNFRRKHLGVVNYHDSFAWAIYSSFTWESGETASFLSVDVRDQKGEWLIIRLCPCVVLERAARSGFATLAFTGTPRATCGELCAYGKSAPKATWIHPAVAPEPFDVALGAAFPELDLLAKLMLTPTLAASLGKGYQLRAIRREDPVLYREIMGRNCGVLSR